MTVRFLKVWGKECWSHVCQSQTLPHHGLLFCIGLLSSVGSLNITASNTTLTLTWEPPFTLDITGVDPDITGYCVDVINATSSVTLHSECGINTTMFTYPIPKNTNCTVEFIVTPHNIVGQGQSTAESYIGVRSSRSHHCIIILSS